MACILKGKVSRKTFDPTQNRQQTNSTTSNPQYGCPQGFTKLSEYICVHLHQDNDLKAIESAFAESQEYCRNQNVESSLLYFLNLDDALRFWKWSGKHMKLKI